MDRAFQKILAHDSKALARIITDSVRVKAGVVSADEKESGLRRILNFGHTVGHALESASGYTHFLHGEAVAWGMIAAAEIARQAGICKAQTAAQIHESVLKYGPLPPVTCSVDDVLSRLASDKKTIAGAVHFVLPQKIGKVEITSWVSEPVIRSAVEMIRNHA
jgi:3-dehydroquinate synthase